MRKSCLILILLVSLMGCNMTTIPSVDVAKTSRFIAVEKHGDYDILRDTQTGRLYFVGSNSNPHFLEINLSRLTATGNQGEPLQWNIEKQTFTPSPLSLLPEQKPAEKPEK